MKALLRLSAAFPQPPVDPRTIALYVEKLARFEAEHIEAACEWSIEHSQHFPRLSELLAVIYRARSAEAATRKVLHEREERAGWELRAAESGATEVRYAFRGGVLDGQTWTLDELNGPDGLRGFPNSVYERAAQAQTALLEQRIQENIERRIARGETVTATPKKDAPTGRRVRGLMEGFKL